MKYITLIFALFIFSCEQAQQELEEVHATPEILEELPAPIYIPEQNYDTYLAQLNAKLKDQNKTTAEIQQLLFESINKEMPAYWRGTTWDFNGISTTPGEGEIACGYYVTTPLKQLGFPIKRFWLAQQASAKIVEELTVSRKRFTTIEALEAYLKSQPVPSAYVIGLDFHTGFITHSSEGSFFIHSNYIGREGVIKEKISESAALSHSEAFVIGNLTSNTNLLQRWRKN